MGQANLADRELEAGDPARIEALLHDHERRPEAITGEDVGARLIRLILQIAQLEHHLAATEDEIAALRASDLYQLRQQIDAEEAQGRDPLGQLAAQLHRQIETLRRALAELIP